MEIKADVFTLAFPPFRAGQEKQVIFCFSSLQGYGNKSICFYPCFSTLQGGARKASDILLFLPSGLWK